MVALGFSPRPITILTLLGANSISPTRKEREIFNQLAAEDEAYKQIVTPVIAHILEKIANTNNQRYNISTPFDFQTPPGISAGRYLERIVKYTPCSKECYFVALVFLDRIMENSSLLVTERNLHRLLITSIMISAKLLDDETFNNGYYSKVGGLTVSEINALEIRFLELLKYNLSVTADTVQHYRSELERQCLAEANTESDSSLSSLSLTSDEELNGSDPDFPRPLSLSTGSACVTLLGMEKKLRRSKSFSNEPSFKTHRRRRSSSFHIEIQSLVVLA